MPNTELDFFSNERDAFFERKNKYLNSKRFKILSLDTNNYVIKSLLTEMISAEYLHEL